MSLQVLVVHVGERLSTDPSSYASNDAFKTWLATASSVPAATQILLTPSGKQAKFAALHRETDVFLYDRQLLFASSDEQPEPTSHDLVTIESLTEPPDTLADQNELDSWKRLFKDRRAWALDVVDRANRLSQQLSGHADAVNIMRRGVGVATGNLDSHISNLEQRHGGAKEWSDGLIQEQQEILDAMKPSLKALNTLPADARFASLIPLLSSTATPATSTLDGFFSSDRLQSAFKAIKRDILAFSDRSTGLNEKVQGVTRDAAALFETVAKASSGSMSAAENDNAQLLEEIQVLANKVASDCEYVTTLPTAQRSVSQASKMALLHTRDYLPALREYHQEMGDSLNKIIGARNRVTAQTAENMRKVASLEAAFSDADNEVKRLDFAATDDDDIALISLASQFAFVYGALMLESVRRREWSEKIRSESATLAEDIAGYREEEERRRKKWAKHIGGIISEESAIGGVLDFELNLRADGSSWPEVSRDEVRQYIDALKALGPSQADSVEELEAGFQDLDRPTKRQLKTAKNFKAGSVHEAFSGKGSFLFRENDEVKALRESNSKLEDEVKSQKSRVRKLEDLLYRQTQSGRSTSGNTLFQIQDGTPPNAGGSSPSQRESLSRQHSHGSRRASVNKSGEEKALARRIVSLEAELHAEKQKRQELEEAATGRQAKSAQMRSELEDTRSTKQDLMANLDAQQREFFSERRLLEQDIEKHKIRVEELEDELEKALGSRDNSRVLVEERTRTLENELELANKTIDNLREDAKKLEESREENSKALRAIHAALLPDSAAPANLAELIDSIESLAERTVRQIRELNQTLSATRSEREELQTTIERKESEALETRDQIQSVEHELTTLRSDLSTEKARSTSLNEELEDGRQQLKNLRAKFAEGETGSEALRQRVEQQASRASALSTELAQSKSHVNSLDVELSSLQRKYQILTQSSGKAAGALEKRSSRAKELTSRLVAYHQELARLLDSLNLSVLRKDGALFIQRSSKLATQSAATLPDSTVGLPFQAFDTSIDPALSSWMSATSDQDEGEKFTKLVGRIDAFNLTTFSEAVIKLRRDVEWTGKKWKMEARNYRDKYHRAQGEARDKIAYRSFKEGDLALFLPTRNQATRPWAAFNVGAPHYFLRERDTHHLKNREWLVARIQKIDERVVDLSRNMTDSLRVGDRRSVGETSEGGSLMEDDNPFELSDGLRWFFVDAAEDRPGAPSTPGLGKSTVASANVDAAGSISEPKPAAGRDASHKLNKSLESRRSSSNSKRGSISAGVGIGRDHSDSNAAPMSPTIVEPAGGQPGKAAALRPGSRSSVGPGPSALGHEVSREPDSTTAEEQAKTSLRASAAASPPAAGLLGLFGSPPKTWLRRGGSSRSSNNDEHQDGKRPSSQQQNLQATSSPKPRPSPVRVQSSQSTGSPSKPGNTKAKNSSGGGGWESLWSLDLSLEEKGKGRGGGS